MPRPTHPPDPAFAVDPEVHVRELRAEVHELSQAIAFLLIATCKAKVADVVLGELAELQASVRAAGLERATRELERMNTTIPAGARTA